MDAMGLGWVIMLPDGHRPLILQKSGGLQGMFLYVAIAPTRGVGAFFVMNEFNAAGFRLGSRRRTISSQSSLRADFRADQGERAR